MNETAQPTPRAHARRIWSEFVPFEDLRSASVVRLLGRYPLQVLVAVLPHQIGEAQVLARALAGTGLSLGVWPMLERSDGRWASTHNAHTFERYVRELAAALPCGTPMAIDLEPPIEITHKLLQGRPSAFRALQTQRNWERGRQTLRILLSDLCRSGTPLIAAANPMLLADRGGRHGWQRFFGTPALDEHYSAVSFMTYTSLIEGYSRGALSREVARSMLSRTALAAARELGGRASISLGTVGTGVLGDERPYRDIAELADDVGICLAAGVCDLALFDLSGVLQTGAPERWLDAFVRTPAQRSLPKGRRRTELIATAIKAGGRLLQGY